MTLTITIGELSAAVRVTTDPTSGPPEPYLTEMTRHLAVAEASIDRYAEDAPDVVKNEAAVRFVGYLLEAPPVSRLGATTSGTHWGLTHSATAAPRRSYPAGTHWGLRGWVWRNAHTPRQDHRDTAAGCDARGLRRRGRGLGGAGHGLGAREPDGPTRRSRTPPTGRR